MTTRQERWDKEERDSHLAMMRTQDNWPNWPLLYMKKRRGSGQWPAFGVLLGEMDDSHKPIVYVGQVFREPLKNMTQTQYASFEAMYDDGWRVD